MANNKTNGYDDEEMTVELELDDGQTVNCAIITILTVKEQDYIVLLPLDENGNNDDGEVWFYRYSEDENDPDAEPELGYIDNDDEFIIPEDMVERIKDVIYKRNLLNVERVTNEVPVKDNINQQQIDV